MEIMPKNLVQFSSVPNTKCSLAQLVAKVKSLSYSHFQSLISNPPFFFKIIAFLVAATGVSYLISRIVWNYLPPKKCTKQEDTISALRMIKIDSAFGLSEQVSLSSFDLRSISPSIQMPTGIVNPDNNDAMIATLQMISANPNLTEYFLEALYEISLDEKWEINPFLETDGLNQTLVKKLDRHFAGLQKLIKTPVNQWEFCAKLNLKSLYFFITLQKSAELALFLMKKWLGDSINQPHLLTKRESQLLRLSLIKLINFEKKSSVFPLNSEAFKLPGIDDGMSPLSQDSLCAKNFLFKLLKALNHMNLSSKEPPFKISLERKKQSFQAKGFLADRLIKTQVHIETLLHFKASLKGNVSIESLIHSHNEHSDSRGCFDEKTQRFIPHHPHYVLDDLEKTATGAKCLTHEFITKKISLSKNFFVHLSSNKAINSDLKSQDFHVEFSDSEKFLVDYSQEKDMPVHSYQLTAAIVQAGPHVHSGPYKVYLKKTSQGGQNVFFKCHNESIELVTHEELQKLFHAELIDPLWGPVSPSILCFSLI